MPSPHDNSMSDPLWGLMGRLFRAHPWHGIAYGDGAPETVTAYVEIVPTDTVKYELDKLTGYLKVDRPQRYSNVCPSLYGFVPRTLCGSRVAERCAEVSGRDGIVGDGDPMDICVISEKTISHADIILQAIPIGGFRMIDGNEADDKIIAVLKGDLIYGGWRDIEDAPGEMVERLRHYFLTYKDSPGSESPRCEIVQTYGREEAHEILQRSHADYHARFGTLEKLLTTALRG
ncbi:MAG: inorganic pyrophosphatase [Chloroflexi bacterium]|nr:inorganic pyrophosphatase [Chloroflexota bacterium]